MEAKDIAEGLFKLVTALVNLVMKINGQVLPTGQIFFQYHLGVI